MPSCIAVPGGSLPRVAVSAFGYVYSVDQHAEQTPTIQDFKDCLDVRLTRHVRSHYQDHAVAEVADYFGVRQPECGRCVEDHPVVTGRDLRDELGHFR